MPSERTRRKDDTWTTDELNKALKRDDTGKRRHRDDDDRRRRHRDDVNGDSDDRRRRHKDDDRKSHRDASEDKRRHRKDRSPDGKIDLTEDERERQRRERRERKEKKEPAKPEKKEKKRDAPVIDDDDDGRRRHRDRDDDRRKHRDDDRERRRKDDDSERRRKDDDRERRRKDDDKKHKRDGDDRKRNHDDDRRRRRDDDSRRREKDDDGGSRRRHKEDENKRRPRDEDDRDKRRRDRHEDNDRRKSHSRHRQRESPEGSLLTKEDREKQRQERRERKEKKDTDTRKDHDEKKDRGKEDRRHRDRYEDQKEEKETVSQRKKDPEPDPDEEEEGDDYNYDEEDFEDYDDDFEDEEADDDNGDKPKQSLNEMDALMRAMDEENNRLANGSRRSNRSDETDESEERYKAPEPKVSRGRTFIDFVSAKQVALSSKTASRTRKRGEDLLHMIELDKARYDMFDLPPVREYEMYIRSFGRSNTKQAYVQTNEDNIDRDIQTDDIDTKEKWTQHPSDDLLGVGGDGIDPEDVKDNQIISRHGDTVKLAKFVEKVGQTIGMLLDEEREGADRHNMASTKSNVGFSDGFNELGRPKFLEDRSVTHACFCPSQPNMLLTVFSSPAQPSVENPVDSHGLICAWNVNDLTYPYRILCCEAQPACCCYSPTRASLAFCGMLDGSVVVWDLREAASMHRTVTVQEQEHVLRFPTYNTARVLEDDNHHSPVTTIIPVYSITHGSKSEDTSDTSTGLSFQLATVEQSGVVNLWVVTEISSPDMAGSEVDLGLAPGGRIKLLKSSSIVLQSPNKATKGSIQAFEMQLLPSDLNHFYVGTDTGCVLHGIRFGSRGFPHSYSPLIESPVNVTTIDFSPFGSPYLLAGCDDGSLYLYHTKSENPLLSWPVFCKGCGVRCVRWSRSRPTVFYVLDESSTVHVMDLLESDSTPIQRDQVTPGRVITMCLTNDSKLSAAGASKSPQMLLALDNGRTEVHSIIRKLTEIQTLEEDFMEKYVDKF